jgi:uncharacterized membrane protein YkoI
LIRRVISPLESMMRKYICVAAAAALGSTGAFAAGAGHFAGSNLLPKSKITLAQARATALAARAGQITDQEFDIKSNGKTFEVGVDARTGKVLENKAEGPNPD